MSTNGGNTSDQAKLWNGLGGQGWVEAQQVMDDLLRPFESRLLEEILSAKTEGSTRSVLDVGCGTGSTTIATAQALGSRGSCVGIDISEPMLALARDRAQAAGLPIEFICADAQGHALKPARFDTIASRFGVMFFDDPIKAFSNLHNGTKSDGELCFFAWRSPEENPFMIVPLHAAAPFVAVPEQEPNKPGQFGFADRKRVEHILIKSGWQDIEIQEFDTVCSMPEKDLRTFLSKVGPISRLVADEDIEKKLRVLEATCAELEPYRHGSEIRFEAACWLVRARA